MKHQLLYNINLDSQKISNCKKLLKTWFDLDKNEQPNLLQLNSIITEKKKIEDKLIKELDISDKVKSLSNKEHNKYAFAIFSIIDSIEIDQNKMPKHSIRAKEMEAIDIINKKLNLDESFFENQLVKTLQYVKLAQDYSDATNTNVSYQTYLYLDTMYQTLSKMNFINVEKLQKYEMYKQVSLEDLEKDQ